MLRRLVILIGAGLLAFVLVSAAPNKVLASTPPANVQAFINAYLAYAQEQYQLYGVPVSVQLDQGGIESGSWNLHPANNWFFNITNEYANPGNPSVVLNDPYTTRAVFSSQVNHWFRAYDTPEKAWLDYGLFLKTDSNYTSAWADVANPRQFLQDIYCIYTVGSANDPKCTPGGALQIWDDWTSQYDNTNSSQVTDISNPDAYSCSQAGYITFEGLPDGTNLSSGTISGVQFTTTNGYTWLVGDFATGNYNGKYPNGAYTSHGTHWAWLGITQGAGRIDFPKGPASYFSLLASDNSALYVDAYGVSDNFLATAGPAPANANTGHMSELKITRATKDMGYVMVHDQGNYFLVDDVCTNAPETPNTIKRVVDQTYSMQTGQQVSGNFVIDFVAGARQFLHIFLGPFFSDVSLTLTRPDGSVVSPTDPGVTYTKTANSIDVFIHNAVAGQWGYGIIANQLEAGGESLHIVADEESILTPTALPIYLPIILK